MSRALLVVCLLALLVYVFRLLSRTPRLVGQQEPDYYAEWLALWERTAA